MTCLCSKERQYIHSPNEPSSYSYDKYDCAILPLLENCVREKESAAKETVVFISSRINFQGLIIYFTMRIEITTSTTVFCTYCGWQYDRHQLSRVSIRFVHKNIKRFPRGGETYKEEAHYLIFFFFCVNFTKHLRSSLLRRMQSSKIVLQLILSPTVH